MRNLLIVTSLLLAASVQANAAEILHPTAPSDLSRFVGRTLHGANNANLGIVARADTANGVIGVVSPHGQFVRMDVSMLMQSGSSELRAPTLSIGDIAKEPRDTLHLASASAVTRLSQR